MYICRAFIIGFFTLLLSNTVLGQQDTSKVHSDNMQQIDTSRNNLAREVEKTIGLTDSIRTLASRVNELRSEVDSLEKRASGQTSEVQKLERKKNELSQATKRLEKVNADIVNQEATLVMLKTDWDALRADLDAVQGQLEEAEKKKRTAEDEAKSAHEKLKSFKDESNKISILISKQLDSLETIGKIEMNDCAKMYDSSQHFTRINIKEVHVRVKEGILMEIIVNTDSGIFRNKGAIVDLLHFGDRLKDKLYFEKLLKTQNYKKERYLEIGDVINYTPYRSYNSIPYAEFNIDLYPNDENRSYLIRESTSINSYFEIAAFTDIKGISGDANGLAQFTADAKFITNTKNFRNVSIVPFNFVSFCGGISRFDTEFKGAQVESGTINRKDIFQRANYVIGIKVNLIKGFSSPKPRHLFNDYQLNIGYNFLGSRVFDTLFKDDAKTVMDTTFRNISQGQFFIQPSLSLSRNRNFSMNFSLPLFFNNLMKSAGLTNRELEFWMCPSVHLMYFSKRDSGNKIFFRYNHFINLREPSQAFTQMQLGYSVNLTDILSKK